jgi:hypothetical protein
MVKTKTKKPVAASRTKAVAAQQELDGGYFLKLVLYLVLGAFWVKLTVGGYRIPLAVGLVVGLYFTRFEKFQVDKKIEYAILLVAMLIGYFVPFGMYINL